MNRLYYLFFLLAIILISGCSKDDLVEDTSSIYLKEYSFEDIFFADTTIVYNFNDDRWEDFTLQLEWTFDTAVVYDCRVDIDHMMWFHYYTDLTCGMSDFKEWETQTEWQIGDTVSDYSNINGFSWSSGGGAIASNADGVRTWLSDLRNNDLYWAFYLESEGKIHYGWVRLNCNLIVESAINLIPGEPILIGQRE